MTTSMNDRDSIVTLFRAVFPEPVMALSGLVLLLLTVPTSAAVIFDDTLLQGQNIWMKTLRFQLSLAIYLLTLSAYARWLPSRIMADPRHRIAAWLMVAAMFASALRVPRAASLSPPITATSP